MSFKWESSGVSGKFYGGAGWWWWYIAIIESALGPDLKSREREEFQVNL